MIYVVSGFQRSGTSLMMGCLVESGIPPYTDAHREAHTKHLNRPDYVVNDKFYEVGPQNYMRLGFTTEVPENHCVKIMALALPILAAGAAYKIILMRRNPDEIRESSIKAFPGEDFDKLHPEWPSNYWNLLEGTKAIMTMRRDVELIEVWFDKLIENPRREFQRIAAMGVPIDADKCAKMVNPEMYRWRAHG